MALKREVDKGSTFAFTGQDLSYIANVNFTQSRTHVKITRQWKSTLIQKRKTTVEPVRMDHL